MELQLSKFESTHEMVDYKLKKIKEHEQMLEEKKRREKRLAKIREGEEDDPEEEEKKKKPLPRLVLCTYQTRYRVVKKSCRRLDFRLNDDENADWDLYWSDTGFQPEKIKKLLPYQRINHYPGMYCLAHKNHLSRNLRRM